MSNSPNYSNKISKLIKNVFLVFFGIIFSWLIFVNFTNAATQWVMDSMACNMTDPTNFPGQNCSPNRMCGDSTGIAQCYNTSSLLPPSVSATSNTLYSASYPNGGYIINCYATADATAPYCDNGGAYWCNRSNTCYSTQRRDTICTANAWGTATCGNCRIGYGDCDLDGGVCEVQFNETDYPSGVHNHYGSTCNVSDVRCDSGYYDCDGSGVSAGNGCEAVRTGACVTGGGLDGVWSCSVDAGGSCTDGGSNYTCNCVPPKQYYETGIKAQYGTTKPLLWGGQFGTGRLIQFGNSKNEELFIVNNDGSVELAQITAPAITTNKLYNVGGSLYWNGTAVGSGGGSGGGWVDDGTVVRLETPTDFVGIGTANPDAPLDVVSPDVGLIVKFENPEIPNGFGIGTDLCGGEAGFYDLSTYNLIVGQSNYDSNLVMLGYNVLFADQTTKNVGIGTDNPIALLDVVSSDVGLIAKFENLDIPNGFGIGTDLWGGEAGFYDLSTGQLIVGQSNDDPNLVMLGNQALFVDQTTKYVGISDAYMTPRFPLHVVSDNNGMNTGFEINDTSRGGLFIGNASVYSEDEVGLYDFYDYPLIAIDAKNSIVHHGANINVNLETWKVGINKFNDNTANAYLEIVDPYPVPGIEPLLRLNNGAGVIDMFVVSSNPNGVLTAPRGSLAMDYVNGKLYINQDNVDDWNMLGSGWIDDGTVVRLETVTDYVGIGMLTPLYKFDVDAGNKAVISRFKNVDASFFIASDLYGGEAGLYNANTKELIVGQSIGNDNLVMVGQNVIYIDQTAKNVGIGINNPHARLDIGEGIISTPRGDTSILLTHDGGDTFLETTSVDMAEGILMRGTYGSPNSDYGVIRQLSSNGYANGWERGLHIFTGDNGVSSDPIIFSIDGNEVMRMVDNGYIGIGTPSPSSKLHLHNSVVDSDWITMTGFKAGYLKIGYSMSTGIIDYNHLVPNNDFSFMSAGSEVMHLTAGRKVGIGTNSPELRFHVVQFSDAVAAFDRMVNDGTVISIRQNGTEEGTISVSENTVSYNAFTGSHYTWHEGKIEKGMLVSLTGKNKRLHDDEKSEILYGVEVNRQANNSKILGSYLSILESEEAQSTSNPALVMAVGNGELWVADKGENIEASDYLISSDLAGHAQKMDSNYALNYVVARAAEDIDWSKVTESVDGVKHKLITVFFDNLVINTQMVDVIQSNQFLGSQLNFAKMNKKEVDKIKKQLGGEISAVAFSTFDEMQVGQAIIPSKQSAIEIKFNQAYKNAPIVMLTLASDSNLMRYFVSDVTTSGFRLNLYPTQYNDTLFNWQAYPYSGVQTAESNIVEKQILENFSIINSAVEDEASIIIDLEEENIQSENDLENSKEFINITSEVDSEEINSLKLDNAADILYNSSLSIIEVGEELGTQIENEDLIKEELMIETETAE